MDRRSISEPTDLVVIELPEGELLVDSSSKVETIRVIGYDGSLAVRIQRLANQRANAGKTSRTFRQSRQ